MAMLRLDPRYPLVWRTPTAMQLGGRHPLVVLDPVTPTQERMLSALARGVPAESLPAQARCRAAEVAEFLSRLAPVLQRRPATPELPIRIRARDEQGRRVAELARSLGLLGARPGARGSAGVVLGVHAIPPTAYRDWLRTDTPHVGVVLAEDEVRISHVVLPGRTPCLRCDDLHQRDADPCWPALAAQLVTRPAAAAEDPLLRLVGIVTAVRRLRAAAVGRIAAGSLRIATDGTTQAVETTPHPECGCLVDLQQPAHAAG